ncbi:hypothetical protein M2262_002154 [Pseudomonas sp. BIGb0408]|uniref:Uncharacterized protein n=1 Tax=Phytopseudomonas flavescens TaxID=29435 RepID=A0A7Z0BNW8_9GAMM|nr:hypothetical protein [Pseudomonas sp. BIGb0408]NYH73325.1 hypothetical protein [Pseudomonas flavescens]
MSREDHHFPQSGSPNNVGASSLAIAGHGARLHDDYDRFARKRAPTWRCRGRQGLILAGIGGHGARLHDGYDRIARKRAPTWRCCGRQGLILAGIGGHGARLPGGYDRIARKRAPIWRCRGRQGLVLAGDCWPWRTIAWRLRSHRPQAGSYMAVPWTTGADPCWRLAAMAHDCMTATIASPASGLLHGGAVDDRG